MSTSSWETRLLDWAYQGLYHELSRDCMVADDPQLAQAYAHCDRTTALSSRTFHLASGLLPRPKRRAARALYAFCRVTDDIVDRAGDDPGAELAAWRRKVTSDCPANGDTVALAWADTQRAFGIPSLYAEQLIDGVARDLGQRRYETFEELTAYCYGVASTVGLMAMHVIGFSGAEALPYAVKLGVALQLTNILRDVAEDWRAGRLYLPREELAAFQLGEADIERGQVGDRWRRFMRFQIDRVRRLYRESLPGVGLLHTDGRLAIGAAAELYQGILRDIERHDMDVFSRRAHVTTAQKFMRLPGIWWRASVVGYGPLADSGWLARRNTL